MAALALWPAASAWGNVYPVDNANDGADINPGDGVCDANPSPSVDTCTLRAAVQTANSVGGFNTIRVPAGTYPLTIANSAGDEDAAATGDLDLTSSMEIIGIGGTATINGLTPPEEDRVFHIPSSAPSPSVILSNLTISDGRALDGRGGGIKHESGALTITNSSIEGNVAVGTSPRGGGIYSSGGSSLTLTDVNVSGNLAPQDASSSFGAQGGGIYSATPLTFNRVAIFSNNANFGCGGNGGICGGSGGGLYDAGGGTLTNVTVSANIAGSNATSGAGAGGGIVTGGTLTVVNSTIQHNYVQGPNGVGGGNIVSGFGLYLQNTIVSDGELLDGAPPGTENCGNDTGSPFAFNTLGNNLEARSGQASGGASQCGLSPGVNGDITAASAGLGSFDFHGGTTYNYELLPGSPAIEAGGPNGLATDQRGVARPQGAACDIGAYELVSTPPPAGWTCAGPPSSPSPPDTVTSTPAASPTPTSAVAPRKCKRKRKRAAAARKKCKKRR